MMDRRYERNLEAFSGGARLVSFRDLGGIDGGYGSTKSDCAPRFEAKGPSIMESWRLIEISLLPGGVQTLEAKLGSEAGNDVSGKRLVEICSVYW